MQNIRIYLFFSFQLLVGTEGVALYQYAYGWYGVLLSFATAGMPTAVSKFVAKYNAMGDYETSQKMYRASLILMLIMGAVGFLVLYGLAPYISSFIIRSKEPSQSFLDSLTLTMRALSFALLIVPPMSITRGYFQGFQKMKPTAYSQLMEQVVRVIFILVGSFFIVRIIEGSTKWAVAVATFAAAVGALAGVFVLVYYWKKYNGLKAVSAKKVSSLTTRDMFLELFQYSIPIVMVGVAIPLYTLIDQYTVVDILTKSGYSEKGANRVFAYITAYAQKLMMIPISLATGFSLSIIPAITQAFFDKKTEDLKQQILKIYQLLLLFTIPASIGLAVLSYDIFRVIYVDPQTALEGSPYLITSAPIAILAAMFMVSAAILQGMDLQKNTIYATMAGIICKLLLNPILLHLFEGHGAIMGTMIGFVVSNLIMFVIIVKYTKLHIKSLLKSLFFVCLYSLIMMMSILSLKWVGTFILEGNHYIDSLIIVLVSVFVGILVYSSLVMKGKHALDAETKMMILQKLKLSELHRH
ncbi:polysaccharide biosynthesis protein [Bacillus sp. FJAT-52991]|uniref:Polysaccharide biosynthesis protein n=1 Tax=Bacillus kandeliae TaxID=3129297 RepID=A0ABZ2N7F5_9BACI